LQVDSRLLDLNRDGVLRTPASMLVIVLYLARHWLLLLVILVSASVQGPAATSWAYATLSWTVLLVEAPVVVLMGAWLRRVPVGGRIARACWQRGRELLTVGALANLGYSVWYLSQQAVWEPWPDRMVALSVLVDAMIVPIVWRSPVYRALFADFPAATAAAASTGARSGR
jgi:hypothetical protein